MYIQIMYVCNNYLKEAVNSKKSRIDWGIWKVWGKIPNIEISELKYNIIKYHTYGIESCLVVFENKR